MINGILFDMDGTLLDTEPIHLEGWKRAMKEAGLVFSDSLLIRCLGLNNNSMEELFNEVFDSQYDFWDIQNRSEYYIEEIVSAQGIQVKKGFNELSEYLHKNNFQSVIATSSQHDNAVSALKTAGIYEFFDGIVGGDQVSEGKPSPIPFQKAANLIGISDDDAKEQCIAIEDSENGVRSAYNAGIPCIFIKDMKEPCEEVKKMIWKRVDSLADVVKIIDEM